jgi:hypothetical protein
MILESNTTTAFAAVATRDVPGMICFSRALANRPDCRSTATPVEILPPRPGRLPSARRMQSMSTACRAQALISRMVHCLLEIEGLRAGMFFATPETCPRKRIRNARQRSRRLIKRGHELGLWKNGRWQLGSSSAWMQ